MVGELLSNTYRVKRLIGRGGMGEVYEAVHERTGAPFAIKILLADFSGKEELLARFQREAEITSRLRHPNIVKVFDFDKLPDGRPFLAMELLQGQPLDALLVRGQPMSIVRVAGIVDQVGLGLAAAHDAGVVHRDLKPGNLFVEKLAGSDRELLRVLDFGISKVRDSGRLTHTSTIMGTPFYMSPEQALGRSREIDPRSDQFALAAIVYELITGRLAFGADESDGDEVVSVMYRVVHTEPPGFASLGIDLPPEIEKVVRKGLSKKPTDRFESVAAFSIAFSRATRKLVDEARDSEAEESAAPQRRTPPLLGVGAGAIAPAAKTTPLPRPAESAGQTLPMPTTLRSMSGEKLRVDPEAMAAVIPRRRWMPVAVSAVGVALIGAALLWLLGGGPNQTQVAPATATAAERVTESAPAKPSPPAVIAPPLVKVIPTPAAVAPVSSAAPSTASPIEQVHAMPEPEKRLVKKPKKVRAAPSAAKPNEDIF